MKTIQDLQDFVNRHKQWADGMFPDESTAGKLTHLKKEADEVAATPVLEEFADCGMLLLNALSHEGFSVLELCAAMEEKFAVVQKRKLWVKTGQGDYQSVKEQA